MTKLSAMFSSKISIELFETLFLVIECFLSVVLLVAVRCEAFETREREKDAFVFSPAKAN